MPRCWGLSIFGWWGQSKGICDTVTSMTVVWRQCSPRAHSGELTRMGTLGTRGEQTRIQGAACARASLRMPVSVAEAEGSWNTRCGYRQGQVATAKSSLWENQGQSRSWKVGFSKLEGGLVWGQPEHPSGVGRQLGEGGVEVHPAPRSTGPFAEHLCRPRPWGGPLLTHSTALGWSCPGRSGQPALVTVASLWTDSHCRTSSRHLSCSEKVPIKNLLNY